MFLSWVGKVLASSDESASFGHVVAAASFIILILLHITILINPWKMFTNFTYIGKLTDYLFYLTVGGSSVSSIKEIVHVIFAKFGIKPDE